MKILWQSSTVDQFNFAGREYLVKRDDLITPINGNKARKLYGLLAALESGNYKKVISYGGAQSNAMLVLAQLCHYLEIEFHYYTRTVPKWLKQTPIGNLKAALACDMQWHINEASIPESTDKDSSTFLIPQGIAMPEAEQGIKKLAEEIQQYCDENNLKDIAVVQPSGTGTTALYLQQHLSHTVYTVPCIGNKETLTQLFKQLIPDAERYPVILDSEKAYHFGQPYPELLDTYQALSKASNIEFELMYDAKTWLVLQNWKCDLPILYIHNGGTSGNDSMLARYRRLGHL